MKDSENLEMIALSKGVRIISTLYNDIGKGYDNTRKADPEITRRLYNHLQIFDRSQVIDLACGTGNYTITLSNYNLDISGVDISEIMINEAKKKSNNLSWYSADISSHYKVMFSPVYSLILSITTLTVKRYWGRMLFSLRFSVRT